MRKTAFTYNDSFMGAKRHVGKIGQTFPEGRLMSIIFIGIKLFSQPPIFLCSGQSYTAFTKSVFL